MGRGLAAIQQYATHYHTEVRDSEDFSLLSKEILYLWEVIILAFI